MTCIAAMVDGPNVWMAADSMCSAGYDIVPTVNGKILPFGEILVGTAGSARAGVILERKFHLPEPGGYDDVAQYIEGKFTDGIRDCLKENGHAQNWHGQESGDFQFLIACQGRIWSMMGDFCALQINHPYYAVGCGAPYATGALAQMFRTGKKPKPKEWLTQAIEISAEWSIGVGGKIDVVKL